VIKRAARRAGLDPARYAGHSLRAGFVTAALAGGAPERGIMAHTGLRSLSSVRRSMGRGTLFDKSAAANWVCEGPREAARVQSSSATPRASKAQHLRRGRARAPLPEALRDARGRRSDLHTDGARCRSCTGWVAENSDNPVRNALTAHAKLPYMANSSVRRP
jgi:hypothetical protein